MDKEEIPERVLRKIEDWKKRLIDQTRRNRLIFFKETKSSTLEIISPSAQACVDRLVLEEKPWKFFAPAPSPALGVVSSKEEGEPVDEQALYETKASVTPRPGELLCAGRFLPRIEKILRNLHQRSDSDLQERGVRILHLAIGFLRWREMDDSRPIDSPLLLVPVELKRRSARDPFELSPVDEDVVLNPALATKLMNDFRISLPPLPEQWDAGTFTNFLTSLHTLVRPLQWTVAESCWLGLFSFHKLVMFQDLTKNANFVGKHLLVSALAEQRLAPSAEGGGQPVNPEDLDRILAPADSHLVVDADSSQLACIETVKRGTNLVVQGPPGTGKSQTITNIIAGEIARGKRVLFVSEKMAALEVVYKRLRAANLGSYCLELHSQKANKRAVVQELYHTYRTRVVPSAGISGLELSQLEKRRRDLNSYVAALHAKREPLGLTVFQVLGMIASKRNCPGLPTDPDSFAALELQTFDDIRQLGSRLSSLWHVVTEGTRHPWYGSGVRTFTPEIGRQLEETLLRCRDGIHLLRRVSGEAAAALGFGEIAGVPQVEWLLTLLGLLRSSPEIRPEWITRENLEELRGSINELADLSTQINLDIVTLQASYHSDILSLPLDFAEALRDSLTRSSAVFGVDLGDTNEILNITRRTIDWAHGLRDAARAVAEPLRIISTTLGIANAESLIEARRHERLAGLCLESARPDESWFDARRMETVALTVPSYRAKVVRRNQLRETLQRNYEDSFFSIDLDRLRADLIERFSTPFRWIKPGFYRLRSLIRVSRRDRKCPSTILEDIDSAREVLRLEKHCREVASDVHQVLGAWYREYETDFERIGRAISVANEILGLTDGAPPAALVTCAHFGQQPPVGLKEAWASLSLEIRGYDNHPCPLPEAASAFFERADLSKLEDFTSRILNTVTPLKTIVETVQSLRLEPKPISANYILKDLELLRRVQLRNAEFNRLAESVADRLGPTFMGISTNWVELREAVEHARTLLVHLQGLAPTAQVVDICQNGGRGVPSSGALDAALSAYRRALEEFAARFLANPSGDYPRTLDTDQPLAVATFNAAETRMDEMLGRLDALRDRVDLARLQGDFQRSKLSDAFDALSRIPALTAEFVVPTIEKAVLQGWLDSIIREDQTLREFRADNHQHKLEEFRLLDRKLVHTGSARVISEIEKQRPSSVVAAPGGEVAVLLREANKKKRHLPIRRLFEEIPGAISHLKPCLLMSPLSVAQFLGPQEHFDLVVFDEASQICSEDAVGAIARGRQLVVCGDNKQLPPTSFFNQSDVDFTDEQSEAEQFDIYESILDQCLSIGLHHASLRWHYRSRHESLIAFSNHRFYDDRLVTFPSPAGLTPELGVSLRLVPAGIFDRGGRADNPIEADQVVAEILAHYHRDPKKSLGVVAFSVAQREAIADRLEFKMRELPDFSEWFSSDRLEGCFVKNLESVQGDERDVIIFSIGYGRDKEGRLTMNFGPLNWEGGQRRLNVAITRAREKVLVVSSISAADFKLSETLPPGVLSLQRYLDYADRGVVALETELARSEGGAESPLESSVASAIRDLGYDVVPQVGCSSYRIDMGVCAPDEPGRFLLAVECDGATYHSSYTARDRDRLRQDVLESFGWVVHRIWGPDWVGRRNTEVQKLRVAIESAVASRGNPGGPVPAPEIAEIVVRNIPREVPESPTLENSYSWAIPYRSCEITTSPLSRREFHDPASRSTLIAMMVEVLSVEAPIHFDLLTKRLADRWGLQRVGERMRNASKRALTYLLKTDTSVCRDGSIISRALDVSVVQVRMPVEGEPETVRRIEQVPPQEIREAIRCLVRDSFSLSENDVLAQVARVFGFDRTGSIIRETVLEILQDMMTQGEIQESGGRLGLLRSP